MSKAVGGYGLACALLVLVTSLGIRPWLTSAQFEGLVMAGAVALVLQVAAFTWLVRVRGTTTHFLAAWIGGTLVRLATVGIVAWIVLGSGRPDPVTTLVGLAGYLFGMLLLEPLFLRSVPATESERPVR